MRLATIKSEGKEVAAIVTEKGIAKIESINEKLNLEQGIKLKTSQNVRGKPQTAEEFMDNIR